MRDEVWDTGERKQESVTGDRPPRAASDPCCSLADKLKPAVPPSRNGLDGSENSQACWILPPLCLPPLKEEILVLLTITVTVTIYMLTDKKPDGIGKK